MLTMEQYTGTKTIKACPMKLGEAEKVLGRAIDTSAVENREDQEGYLVEYEDGYRSWSPKAVFEKAYKVSETYVDRMLIEQKDLEERYLKGRKYSFTQDFRNHNLEECRLLRAQLDVMEKYLYILARRIEVATVPSNG